MSDLLSNYRERIKAVLQAKVPKGKNKNDPGRPWALIAERKTEHSYEYAFRVPVGYRLADVEKFLDAFVANCGAIVELEDRAGAIVFKVFKNDLPDTVKFKPGMIANLKGNDILLGFNRQHAPVIHKWQNPHMIVSGETGWGKTDAIRFILYQLITRISPEDLEIHIVDLKGGVSFLPFRSIPHITRIAYDLKTALHVIHDSYQTMLERLEEVRNIGKRSAFKKYKHRILLIDEAAQISPSQVRTKKEKAIANEIDALLSSIACVGREPGINILYCTQYPHSDIVHPQIKANCGARLCFHLPSKYQSQVVLDADGAEKLSCPGRAIYKSIKSETLQVPFVGDDNAWEKLLAFIKTEVIDGGKSERTKKEPHIVDAGDGQSGNDGADCPPAFSGERIAGEAGVRSIKGTSARKVYRREENEQHAESMEAVDQRPAADGEDLCTSTVEYDEDEPLPGFDGYLR